jgi:hypothetical protein
VKDLSITVPATENFKAITGKGVDVMVESKKIGRADVGIAVGIFSDITASASRNCFGKLQSKSYCELNFIW